MEKRKMLCYLQSVGAAVEVEQYQKVKESILVKAENIFDLLNKSSMADISEIIFDYTCVNEAMQKEVNFEPLATKTRSGTTVKIVNPKTLSEEEIKDKRSTTRFLSMIPNLIHGTFG